MTIDVEPAKKAQTKFIDHKNVLQAVTKKGDLTVLKNARDPTEVLFKEEIPPEAIKVIKVPSD